MNSLLSSHQIEADMAEVLSCHRFPKKWYQGDKSVIVFAILTSLFGYFSVFVFRLQPPPMLSLFSVFLVLSGIAADRITTYCVFSAKPRFEARGLKFSIQEVNPLMPKIPKPSDIFLGKPLIMAAIAILIAFFVPLAGWGIAGFLFAVSLNNQRNRQQALYELELYDTMTQRFGERKEIPA